jgi:hypothetical protein
MLSSQITVQGDAHAVVPQCPGDPQRCRFIIVLFAESTDLRWGSAMRYLFKRKRM